MDWLSPTLTLFGIAASCVIGLGGIGVAALASYLSYRERVAPFREKLYAKKLDIYAELIRVLHNARMFMLMLSLLTDEARAKTVDEASKATIEVFDMAEKHAAFLPDDVLQKITNLHPLMSDWVKFNRSPHPNGNAADEKLEQVLVAHQKVLQAIRKDIGTEALTQQTLDLVTRQRKN